MPPIKASFALLCSILATDADASGQGMVCDDAARMAAEDRGVPLQVLLAITRVETGRNVEGRLSPWPWAINHAGNPYWFETPDEAEAFVQEAAAQGQTNIDIGCFQLNLRWHGQHFPSLKAMFDPWQNADYAARFLKENHARTGNWVDAVALYHSATPALATSYVEKVEAVLLGFETVPFTPTLSDAVPENRSPSIQIRHNAFPLLQAGQQGALASLVPTGQVGKALLGASP
jgi:hypothetical protein